MWDEAWGFKQGNLLQTGVEAAREAMSAMEVKPEKEEDEEQAAASPADDRVRSVEAQRLGAAAEAMAAAEGRGKKLAERMRERVGAGLATWTDKAMATGTEMVLKTQNVALPEPGEIGMRPADMYIKVCRSLRTAPLTSVVAQLGPEARRVVLSGSYLGEGTAKALSSVVPHLRRLESFEAARCGAHDGSLSWLLGALLYCPVTSLDMSGNNLSEVGTVALSRLLIGRDPEVRSLEDDKPMRVGPAQDMLADQHVGARFERKQRVREWQSLRSVRPPSCLEGCFFCIPS